MRRGAHGAAQCQPGARPDALTQRLLTFSRRQPLAPKPLDVNSSSSECRSLLHRTLSEGISMETVLAGALWRISEVVLVVEDDEDVRAQSVQMLGELGYGVLEAADATLALQLLAQRSDVGLLFTDVGLPGGMNGRQLADQGLHLRPGLKVLFTTGYARNAIVHHGRLDPGWSSSSSRSPSRRRQSRFATC